VTEEHEKQYRHRRVAASPGNHAWHVVGEVLDALDAERAAHAATKERVLELSRDNEEMRRQIDSLEIRNADLSDVVDSCRCDEA